MRWGCNGAAAWVLCVCWCMGQRWQRDGKPSSLWKDKGLSGGAWQGKGQSRGARFPSVLSSAYNKPPSLAVGAEQLGEKR